MASEKSKVLHYLAEWGVTMTAIVTVLALFLMGWIGEKGPLGFCGVAESLWSPLSSLCGAS
ncbi:MAG: hypothetical protein D4R76_04660 [Methylococcus sp.]|nr:MAG: hypothetical protein D4R76_04660 [Methylococcus sp.]